MAADNDFTLGRDYLEQLEDARSLSNNLADEFMRMNNISASTKQKMKYIVGSLKGQADISVQITSIVQARDQFIKNEVAAGRIVSQIALDKLDTEIKLLEQKKKQLDFEKEIEEQMKDTKDTIIEMLGGSKEMADIFRTGGILAAGVEAFNNSTQAISDAFSHTLGTAFEMYKTMGISGKEGAILAGEIGKASFSMAGLLYGGEAMAESSKALVDQFGNVNMATSDMVEGVTEINALVGDAAKSVDLALAFQNAGVAVDEVDDILKDIGTKTGVTASKIAKEMADSQYLTVGATKQELKLLGELNAELIKQGATRESIRGSAKSLMDVENTIQQANKIALMTGKQINTSRLTEAAMQARTAEGSENKAKAQNELLRALKEELGVNGNISDQSDVTLEAMTSLTGLTEEQLLNMEKAGYTQENNNKLVEEGSAFWGALTAGATSFGAGLGSATLELIKMIAQAMIFNKVMTGNFGIGNLRFGDGGGTGPAPPAPPTPPTPPTPPPGGGNGGGGGFISSITDAIEKIKPQQLIAGGAALVLVAAAVFVFAKAVQEFMNVSWEAVAMAIVSMLALVGALALVGLIASGPQAIFLLAGAAAMLVIAAAIYVLGKAIQEMATGFKMMGDITTQLTGLVNIAPGLLALAGIFGLLGLSLVALAVGLAAVSAFLPTLLILGAVLPSITSALGIGGGSSETTSSDTKKSDPLLEEIKGLRADIKAQPINVVLNNKIVGEINRASRASNSYVNK